MTVVQGQGKFSHLLRPLLNSLPSMRRANWARHMSSHHLKMLQSADRYLTRKLFRYTGSGAIFVNIYLHIWMCSHNCQFPLVKEIWQTFFKVCLLNLTQMYSSFPLATHPNASALIYTCSLFTALSSFNFNHLTKQFRVPCVICLLS